MGKGYQPPGQPPSWRTRGPHLVWSLSFDLFSMDGPTRSQRLAPADTALCVIETRKTLHLGKVVVPLELNLFNEHHGIGFLLGKKKGWYHTNM